MTSDKIRLHPIYGEGNVEELRKALREAKGSMRKLRELLKQHEIETSIEFEDIERYIMFTFGYLACLEKVGHQD